MAAGIHLFSIQVSISRAMIISSTGSLGRWISVGFPGGEPGLIDRRLGILGTSGWGSWIGAVHLLGSLARDTRAQKNQFLSTPSWICGEVGRSPSGTQGWALGVCWLRGGGGGWPVMKLAAEIAGSVSREHEWTTHHWGLYANVRRLQGRSKHGRGPEGHLPRCSKARELLV